MPNKPYRPGNYIEALQARIIALQAAIIEFEQSRNRDSKTIAELTSHNTALNEQMARMNAEVKEARRDYVAAQQRVAELERQRDEAETQRVEKEQELAQALQTNVTQATQLDAQKAYIARLRESIEEIQREKYSIESELENLRGY